MTRYLVGRVLQAIGVVLAISLITFFILNIIPGDPVELMMGEFATPEAIAQVRTQMGLDKPIAAQYFGAMGKKYGFTLDTPLEDIREEGMNALLYGTGDEQISITYEGARGQREYTTTFEGIIPTLERRYRETTSDAMKQAYEEYMAEEVCPECGGKRLKAEARAVTVGGKSLPEVSDMSIRQAREFFSKLELDGNSRIIAAQILKEIDARLGFLCDVGLEYLMLSRSAGTLSGGEAQRIRLATQIGSALMGVMYILDEPSIGLHQRDNAKLIATLRRNAGSGQHGHCRGA